MVRTGVALFDVYKPIVICLFGKSTILSNLKKPVYSTSDKTAGLVPRKHRHRHRKKPVFIVLNRLI